MFWRWKKSRATDSRDNTGRSAARQELKIAQEAAAAGEFQHAMSHLAWALKDDPCDVEARKLLDRLIQAVIDPLSLVPWTEPETPYPIAAVRAFIQARAGQLEEAVALMRQIYQSIPGVPFVSWLLEWLAIPDRANDLSPDMMSGLVATLAQKIFEGIDPAEYAALEQLLPPLISYRDAHPQATQFVGMLVILMRNMGRMDEALAIGQATYSNHPDYLLSAILGTSYRINGDLDAALSMFRAALQYEPESMEIRLDIADTLCTCGRIQEGVIAYQEILEREPDHPWALPSLFYYSAVLEPQGPWQERLEGYIRSSRDNERAQLLNAHLVPYISSLPEPSDALINLLRQVSEQQADLRTFTVSLSALESPSACLAIELYQLEHFGAADLNVDVAKIQRPDPRLPLGPVEYLLWRYNGNRPQPAVALPSSEVAGMMAAFAAVPYEIDAWSYLGQRSASSLGSASLPDLLGVMVHPPKRQDPFTIWEWVHRVQFAAAFTLAHLDEGWEGSLRRQALLSLARGPMDWTVEAAIVALWRVAVMEPASIADIEALYMQLLDKLPDAGAVPYIQALLLCSMYMPSEKLRKRAERMAKKWFS